MNKLSRISILTFSLGVLVLLFISWYLQTSQYYPQAATDSRPTYYVTMQGNNTHACATREQACRDIQTALTKAPNGSTIIVDDGQYPSFTVTNRHDIIIRAMGNNAQIIDSVDNAVRIQLGSDSIRIEGLEIYNALKRAVFITQSSHITVAKVIMGNNGAMCVLTGSSTYITLEYNTCYSSKTSHGFYISETGDNHVIRNNTIRDNAKSGIQVNSENSVNGVPIRNVRIENNLITGNKENGINLLGVQDSLIINNYIATNGGIGIANAKFFTVTGPKNMRIFHNTVVMADGSKFALQFSGLSGGGNIVRNNIFAHPLGKVIQYGSNNDRNGVISERNALGRGSVAVPLIYVGDTSNTVTSWSQETNPVIFSHPSDIFATTYILKTPSPLKDNGVLVSSVTTDILGLTRPQGSAVDIGAYEVPVAMTTPTSSAIPSGKPSTAPSDTPSTKPSTIPSIVVTPTLIPSMNPSVTSSALTHSPSATSSVATVITSSPLISFSPGPVNTSSQSHTTPQSTTAPIISFFKQLYTPASPEAYSSPSHQTTALSEELLSELEPEESHPSKLFVRLIILGNIAVLLAIVVLIWRRQV